MIQIERINNLKVKPIKITEDNRPVKGGDILGKSPYINIMEVAPTAGGKTTTTNTILMHCVMPRKTIIVAFVPSIYNDENWIEIRERLQDMGNTVVIHTSLKDDEGNDLLKQYVKFLSDKAEEEEQRRLEAKNCIRISKHEKVCINMPKDEEEKRAEREPRCKYAKYIFIFDDISDELKMKSYVALMKKARHYCILTITSTQDAKDITPATIKQMRLWLLFKGIDDERLMHIYSKLGIKLSFADFKRLYDQATQDYYDPNDKKWYRYNFLYFAPRELEFRRNFRDRLVI